MFAEVVPGVVVPLLMATVAMILGRFFEPLHRVTMSKQRWLFCCSIVGLVIPSTILLVFPPNTDAALNATSSLLLWPSHFMLMAADPYTPKSGVAFVVGISVVANVLAYLIIGLVVWLFGPLLLGSVVERESTRPTQLHRQFPTVETSPFRLKSPRPRHASATMGEQKAHACDIAL